MTTYNENYDIFRVGQQMFSGIKTLVFTYFYAVIAIGLPFIIIRYIAIHPWTEQIFWIPLFDSCHPPASPRPLNGIEYERIVISYWGLAIFNALNRSLEFLTDNDGKYIDTYYIFE